MRRRDTWSAFGGTMDHPFGFLIRRDRTVKSENQNSQSGRAIAKKESVSVKSVRSSLLR